MGEMGEHLGEMAAPVPVALHRQVSITGTGSYAAGYAPPSPQSPWAQLVESFAHLGERGWDPVVTETFEWATQHKTETRTAAALQTLFVSQLQGKNLSLPVIEDAAARRSAFAYGRSLTALRRCGRRCALCSSPSGCEPSC